MTHCFSIQEFMAAFVDLQFSCLNPVVSFQRRTFALHNLETLSKVIDLIKTDKSMYVCMSWVSEHCKTCKYVKFSVGTN